MDPAQQQGAAASPPAQPAPPPPAPPASGSASAQLAAAVTTLLNPTMSSAEKSLFPNSVPVRQPLPGIHTFGASGQAASTSAASQVGAGAAAGGYGGQRPGGAPAGGSAKQYGAGAPSYGSIPSLSSASPHTTPTPPIIPPANSPPAGSSPVPPAGSPAVSRSAAPGGAQASPPIPSPIGAAASPPAQPQPQTASAAVPSSRSNPMSVSSMLSGPPRDRSIPSYSPLGPSLGAAAAPSAAPPQPPVLPPEKKAGSPIGALPGFVQGGIKPPTGTTAPGGEKKEQSSTTKPDQPASQAPPQPARSSYPPLPSAFARENPYSPSPSASPAQPQHKPATAGTQTPSAAAASASASPLAPGAPQSAAAAAQIKNSFFPSLGLGGSAGGGLSGYRPGGGIGRTTSAPTGTNQPAQTQQQQQQQQQQTQPQHPPQPTQQYPWQQSHLNPYVGINAASNSLKPQQQQQQGHGRSPSVTGANQQQRPGAAPVAGAPAVQRQVGQAKPPSPQKQPSGGAAGQRFSSLLSEGPFGGRNGAASGVGSSPAAQAQIQQQQHQHPGANGVKRRRSDAQEQQLAHAASGGLHSHVHHQHHHHHASHAQHHPAAASGGSALPPIPAAQHGHTHIHATSHTHAHAPHAHAQTQRVAKTASARSTPPPPIPTTPPPPPAPPFTHTDLRKAMIHPPLVDVKNEAVEAVMKPFLEKEKEGERPFLGRVVYDPLVDPAKLLDGEVLRQGVGGTVEVVVPTSWLLGPLPSASSSASSHLDLPSIRLPCSIPPTDPHPVALSFGPPSAYTGAPLPSTSPATPLQLPPHLVDLPGLRKRKVWGTDVYTDDSDVLAVLLHAGWVRVARRARRARAGDKGAGAEAVRRARVPGERVLNQEEGIEGEQEEHEKVPKALLVTLGVVPPLVRYQGLERQGIRSRSWGNGHDGVSLRVEKVEGIEHIPLSRAHSSRKPSAASFAKRLASLRHDYPHSCVHSVSGSADGHPSHEPPAKRYRFALPSSAANGFNGHHEKDENASLTAAVKEIGEEVIEVTDTFVLDLRTGKGRFVDPEDGEEDEDALDGHGVAMEIEPTGA
ncbi:hypothetical protein JCM11251_003866 [Rhodosporidiobolus azoricus]